MSIEQQHITSPSREKNISPYAFGWIATAAILFIYITGSSVVSVLFADSISAEEGLNITSSNLFLSAIIGQTLFLLLPALLLARIHPLKFKEALRLRVPTFSSFFYAGIGTFACLIVGTAWLLIQELYLVPETWLPFYHSLQSQTEKLGELLLVGQNIPLLLLAIAAIGITPAICEEIAFRGLIQRSFEEQLSPLGAILLTGFLFGAIHLQPVNLIPLVGIGMFLGLVAWASRSIWPAIFGHFLFNTTEILLLNLTDSPLAETQSIATQDTLLSILPLALVAVLLLTGIIVVLIRNRKD